MAGQSLKWRTGCRSLSPTSGLNAREASRPLSLRTALSPAANSASSTHRRERIIGAVLMWTVAFMISQNGGSHEQSSTPPSTMSNRS
jgi:hypothetical protein